MNAHAMQLWEMVTTCAVSSKKKYKSWEKTETTLSRQLTLRMCTAIQIASKIHSFHDVSFYFLLCINCVVFLEPL